jgi:CubicO group peptidase (beta-lactamase class C family)
MCSVFDKYRQSIPKMMAENKIPGHSIALVDRDGILWAAGFGYTDYNRKTPVTSETLFAVMSTSKAITATAAMVAVRDGLLELDVPIIEYLPQFTVNSRFEENPEKKIILRHLLSHTSGIATDAPVGNVREPSYGSLEEHVLSISDTWLRHKVGERFSYSNLAYELVAYIIQIKSGQPFPKYVEDKVFTPLNMTNCSVDPEFIRNHPYRAMGHFPHVKQLPLAIDVPCAGSANVYSSAKGMGKFVQFFLNRGKVDGQTVLDENLITSMVTPSIRTKNYGLGIEIIPNSEGYYILGHGGGGLGFTSGMIWLPEYEIGSVFLFNSEGSAKTIGTIFGDLINANLIQKIESFDIPSSEYLAWQPPGPNTFTPFKPAWKKYIGTYKCIMSGWKPGIFLRIALALGLTTKYTHVKVFEEDGYLYVDTYIVHDHDGGRLDEHLPGLFFTPSGKCLDLRGPKLTWQNYRIKKTDNDTDRNFDLNL